MLELAIRLVFSLAVVVGLLLLLAKFAGRRFSGGKDALITVVHRQHLSRGSAVSVVSVGSRVLVLGTTEHQVSVLAELDPEEVAEHLTGETATEHLAARGSLEGPNEFEDFDEFDELGARDWDGEVVPVPAAIAARAAVTPPARPAPEATVSRLGRRPSNRTQDGPLTGSVLSVDTWRQALAAATRRAS
jgi:flagellar protein FliO/FliZ